MTDSDYDMIGLKIQNSMDEIANLDQRIQQSERRTSRPAGYFNFDYELPFGIGELIITDITGRNYYNSVITGISGTRKLDLSLLENGIYYWKISSGKETSQNGKIVILK